MVCRYRLLGQQAGAGKVLQPPDRRGNRRLRGHQIPFSPSYYDRETFARQCGGAVCAALKRSLDPEQLQS